MILLLWPGGRLEVCEGLLDPERSEPGGRVGVPALLHHPGQGAQMLQQASTMRNQIDLKGRSIFLCIRRMSNCLCITVFIGYIYLCLLPPVGHRRPEALVADRPPHVVEPGIGVDHLEVRLRVLLDAALQRLGAPRQLPEDQAQTARENNVSITTCSNYIHMLFGNILIHAT